MVCLRRQQVPLAGQQQQQRISRPFYLEKERDEDNRWERKNYMFRARRLSYTPYIIALDWLKHPTATPRPSERERAVDGSVIVEDFSVGGGL